MNPNQKPTPRTAYSFPDSFPQFLDRFLETCAHQSQKLSTAQNELVRFPSTDIYRALRQRRDSILGIDPNRSLEKP
jgi:hypothetical protein